MPGPNRRQLIGLGLGPALLGGCTLQPDRDHTGPNAPRSQPLARPPRTAWVFSSGGPRGFVHVGVLKALDELGLKPDVIVGASAGAAVGVLHAAGRSGAELEQLALALQPWRLGRLALQGEERLSGDAIAGLVREHAGRDLLEQLPCPVVCVVQQLPQGGQPAQVLGLNAGDLGLAVQAACAIEGQFTPVRVNGLRLADADLLMPLPVRLARRLGAQRVLAVDASAHEDRAPAGSERYRPGDLRKRALTAPDAALADVLLHPEFGYWVSLSQEFRQRAMRAGYEAAMAQGEALRALHAGAQK